MPFTEVKTLATEQWFDATRALCSSLDIVITIYFSYWGCYKHLVSHWMHFLLGCKGSFALLQVGPWFIMKARAVSFENVYFAAVNYWLTNCSEAHKNMILGGRGGDKARKEMLRDSHFLTSRHKQFSIAESGRNGFKITTPFSLFPSLPLQPKPFQPQ